MKNLLLCAGIVTAASTILFSQPKDELSVRQTLKQVATALKNRDVQTLERIYADDYTFVYSPGTVMNKKQRLSSVTSEKPFEMFVFEDLKVSVYGNSSVVLAKVNSKVAGEDPTISTATITMVKNGGRWQLVATHGMPNSSSEEQILVQIEKELTEALNNGNVSVLERHLSDTYVFTTPGEIVINKTRSVDDVRSGNLKFQSSQVDDMKVQINGHTAVVTYRSKVKGQYKGTDISGVYQLTDVFVKRNGQWKLISRQQNGV